jgi:Cdc6-like AAA superfamily ATPase
MDDAPVDQHAVEDELSPEDAVDLHIAIGKAFSPGAPVDTRDLFAGRTKQLSDLLALTGQRGTHAVVYGERGVGKTSLASVMVTLVMARGNIAARANCDGTDDFTSIWRKVLESIRILDERPRVGFGGERRKTVRTAAAGFPEDEATPNDVKIVLEELGASAEPVIVIDEFDRVTDVPTRELFADTIKTLSDQVVPATLVLVGVAETVDRLIAAHESTERALTQVLMPRMSPQELGEIATRGLGSVDMTIRPEALSLVTRLSQGLPHYTHLLVQQAAIAAVGQHQTRTITTGHVRTALARAIEKAQRSTKDAYHQATASTRETLYPQVLLACALAQGDELGYFAPTDVRDPLTEIMGHKYEIPSFVQHLHALSEPERGPVLHKRGAPRRYRFRFINPLLQPYVVMHGVEEELITTAALDSRVGQHELGAG